MSVTTSRSILSEGNAAALAALRTALGGDSSVSTRELDRMALAVDASHYLHAPDAVMRAKSPTDVGVAMRVAAGLGSRSPTTLLSEISATGGGQLQAGNPM